MPTQPQATLGQFATPLPEGTPAVRPVEQNPEAIAANTEQWRQLLAREDLLRGAGIAGAYVSAGQPFGLGLMAALNQQAESGQLRQAAAFEQQGLDQRQSEADQRAEAEGQRISLGEQRLAETGRSNLAQEELSRQDLTRRSAADTATAQYRQDDLALKRRQLDLAARRGGPGGAGGPAAAKAHREAMSMSWDEARAKWGNRADYIEDGGDPAVYDEGFAWDAGVAYSRLTGAALPTRRPRTETDLTPAAESGATATPPPPRTSFVPGVSSVAPVKSVEDLQRENVQAEAARGPANRPFEAKSQEVRKRFTPVQRNAQIVMGSGLALVGPQKEQRLQQALTNIQQYTDTEDWKLLDEAQQRQAFELKNQLLTELNRLKLPR